MSLRVDPETGLVLEEGCRPRRGGPRRELFREGHEPITVCPERGRRSWFESLFGARRAAPRIPGETDPHLGVPRLPHRDPGGSPR